jgi:hypothetical protein
VKHDVVDQAGFADAGCYRNQDWAVERRVARERFGVHCFDVFDLDAFDSLEYAGCREHDFLGAAWVAAMLVAGGAEREAQC